MIMRKEFPEQYDFFPITYVLPQEMNLFKNQFSKPEESNANQKQDQ